MLWRVDCDLFKNNDLRSRPSSLCILFGRKYLHRFVGYKQRNAQNAQNTLQAFSGVVIVVADNETKTTACRADLMCCYMYAPEIPLLLHKIYAAVFA